MQQPAPPTEEPVSFVPHPTVVVLVQRQGRSGYPRRRFDSDRPPHQPMLAGGPANMSTNPETSTVASAEVTTLPIVTKPGRVPIESWAGEFEPRTLEQAMNVSNLPLAIDHVALMPDGHAGYGMPIG